MYRWSALLGAAVAVAVAGCSDAVPGGPAGDGSGGSGGTSSGGSGGTSSGGSGGTSSGGSGGVQLATACGPLPAPQGPVLHVTPADDLAAAVAGAAAGTTILLEDGSYPRTRLVFRTRGVTLRSASGSATGVVLDGEYQVSEIASVFASDITIADVTLMRAVDHLVHASPEGEDVTGLLLHGLRLVDGGEQFVKINPDGGRTHWVDGGVIECSLFRMTDAGRPSVERNPGGCYTGGVDGHGARGFVVRENRFEDLYCAGEGLAEHAIHFWTGSRDTLIERNVILGCARGIGLGLVQDGERRVYADDPGVGYLGHIDGLVRNNVVFADHPYFDTGIELDQARGAVVLHNTVIAGPGATGFFSGIDYRFANTQVVLVNNLTTRITLRDGASATLEANLEATPLSLFDGALGGDLHLDAGAAAALDAGVVRADAGLDLDGEPHDHGAPDLGADELWP